MTSQLTISSDKTNGNINKIKMLGYDVDGVLLDFRERVYQLQGLIPPFTSDTWEIPMDWDVIWRHPRYWSNLKRLIDPKSMSRLPDYYITSLPPQFKTARIRNLLDCGFHNANPYNVLVSSDKVKTCKSRGVTEFVDDKPSTVKSLNEAGIKCWQLYPDYARWEVVVGNELLITSVDELKTSVPVPTYERYSDNDDVEYKQINEVDTYPDAVYFNEWLTEKLGGIISENHE